MELAPTRSMWAMMEKFLILDWSVMNRSSHKRCVGAAVLSRPPCQVPWADEDTGPCDPKEPYFFPRCSTARFTRSPVV